jgi:ribonucleotide reductase alpha subunit
VTDEIEMSEFARTIMEHKYSHTLANGEKENWGNIAYRVTKNVMKAVGYTMRDKLAQDICKMITERKFMPGGRYLYASGRPYRQTQNCLLMKVHDSREGWSELLHNGSMALMTGAGIGVDYSELRCNGANIRRTGGVATGPIALMQMLNECGRGIMQGGNRRSAIWAGLRWDHPDIHRFIRIKNWIPEVKAMKAKDFSFPATLDCTNISVLLNDEFFEAYEDEDHQKHSLAHSVYWATIEQMLESGEPGFSIDVGKNAGETLRNAPVAGDTYVLTDSGYKQVNDIVGLPTKVWTGYQFAEATFVKTKCDVETVSVTMTGGRTIVCDPTHEFFVRHYTGKGQRRKLEVMKVCASELSEGDYLDVSLPSSLPVSLNEQSWTNGFVFGDGSIKDVTLCTDEKKSLSHLLQGVKSQSINDRRGYDRYYFSDTQIKDQLDVGECLQSFLAGWFDADGSYDPVEQRIRLSGEYTSLIECRRLLETLGILSTISLPISSGYGGKQDTRNLSILASSVCDFNRLIPCQRLRLNTKGYKAYRQSEIAVVSIDDGPIQDVYCCDVGVKEHSFVAEGVRLSNCTEITSRDDSDICNLGSLNLARIETIEEFKQCVELGTAFLLAGTVYSDVPYEKVDRVRTKNRRLGLGLMGVHEWLLKRGRPYGPDEELGRWLHQYKKSTKIAHNYADEWDLSRPKKTRAIAPTGTIAIVAETTTGAESIFAVAIKRRYLKHDQWCYQYVIDPTAKRLIKEGADPGSIEDAYTLAENVERRVSFQAWLQQYVDHGISSTLNLPHWGSESNNSHTVRPFGSMLIRYLPSLRGITCYPDGCRGGQPLVPVPYEEAIKHEGVELVEEPTLICDIAKGGDCGS